MVDWTRYKMGAAAVALAAVGAIGGAAVVSSTRPSVEMAPTIATPIARLAQADGIVTVKGRVAETYGDRFVVQDATGRTLVDAGRESAGAISAGSTVTVQGRYGDGQLHASYLIDAAGRVAAVGGPRHGGRGHDGPGRDLGGRHGPDDAPPPAMDDAPPPSPAAAPAPVPAQP